VNVLLVLATSGGGVGRHVAELAAGLAEAAGNEVRVAGPAVTDGDFGFTAAGVGFEPFDVADRPRPAADRRAVRRLRALATGTGVVHAHGLRAGALAVLAVRRIRPREQRPKVVVTLHNALVAGGAIALVHGVLERIVARGADAVLVVSADLGEAMGRRGARDVRLALVPAPALPPAGRKPADVRQELGVPDGTFLLLTVGRLAPQKGLDVLLTAIGRLGEANGDSEADVGGEARGQGEVIGGREAGGRSERPAIRAVIAGEGPLRAELGATIEAANLPVTLLGNRSDVPDLLAAADLVVLPSRWEGQPLIVQEALRAGAAICATDAGGTAAVTRDAAVLVPPNEPILLAEALAGLLADPAALAALRERSRIRGTTLPTAHDALQQVESVYREITRPV